MKLRHVLFPFLGLAITAGALTAADGAAPLVHPARPIASASRALAGRAVAGTQAVRAGSAAALTRPALARPAAVGAAPRAVSPSVTTLVKPPRIGPGTTLPIVDVEHIEVDGTDGYVFLDGGSQAAGVVVTDLATHVVTTLVPADFPGTVAVDEAAHRLYVYLPATGVVDVFDSATLTLVTSLTTGDAIGYFGIGYSPGKVWLLGGASNPGGIDSVDVATGMITALPLSGVSLTGLRNVPGHPGLLAVTQNESLVLVDVSTGTPVAGNVLPGGTAVTFTPDGTRAGGGGRLYTVPDFTPAGTFADSGYQTVLGTTSSATGGYYDDDYHPNIVLTQFGATTWTRGYVTGRNIAKLAYSADGDTLYVAGDNGSGKDVSLAVLYGVSTVVSTITVTTPHHAALGKTVTPTGTLSFTGVPATTACHRTIHVTRTDNAGVHALPDVTTDASRRVHHHRPRRRSGRRSTP